MHQRVARGETIGFISVRELDKLLDLLQHFSETGFTGRLTGVVKHGGGEEEFTILLDGGRVVVSVLGDKPVEPEEVARRLVEASEGYVEVERLDKAGIELELDYAKEAGARGEPRPLDGFIKVLEEGLRRRKGREEASQRAQIITERLQEIVEVDSEAVRRTSEAYASNYDQILRAIEEAAHSKRRVRTEKPETVLEDVLSRLADTSYVAVHARYDGSEALVVIRGHRLCLALEKAGGEARPVGKELIEKLVGTPGTYTIYVADIRSLDQALPLCIPTREHHEKGNGKDERGIVGRLRKWLLGRPAT